MARRQEMTVEAGMSETRQAAGVPALTRARTAWPSPPGVWRRGLLRRMLACADLAAAFLASVTLVFINDGRTGRVAWALIALPLWIVLAKVLGLYDVNARTLRHVTVDEVPRLALWALLGVSGLSVLVTLGPSRQPVASSGLLAGIVAFTSVILLRAVARLLWRRITPQERIAAVGVPSAIAEISRKLALFPDLHMRIVEERAMDDVDGLTELATSGDFDRLLVAPEALTQERVTDFIAVCRTAGMPLSIVPPCRSLFGSATRLQHIAELPLLTVGTDDLSRSTLLLKRAMDVALSATALVILLPVFLVVAVAIKIDSRGPVFFSQLRAGRYGYPFRMYKFRSMVASAEELLPQLINVAELPEPVFKIADDPRVTRVGGVLRRWSVDELPQLWNVLVGDMSLVGPRPEQLDLVDRYTAAQRHRLDVNPGMTGPMQVYGRGRLTLTERTALENDYVENLSLVRDLELLSRTVGAVLGGGGAT